MSYNQGHSSTNDKTLDTSSEESQNEDLSEDKENKYEVYDIKKYYESMKVEHQYLPKHPKKPCYANASTSFSSASYSDEEENMPSSFHGSFISKKFIKENVKPKFSCGCSSCIAFSEDTYGYINTMAPEKYKPKTKDEEMEDKHRIASTSECKDSENSVYVLQVNTPLKRKPPPKGPFPYKERKFFKSGGLLSRSQETRSHFSFDDDSTHSND